MNIVKLPAATTEFARVEVTRTLNGTVADPTGLNAEMAIVPHGIAPAAPDWHAATWETDAAQQEYFARLIFTAKPIGRYDVWSRVTDAPELPVRKAGELILTR